MNILDRVDPVAGLHIFGRRDFFFILALERRGAGGPEWDDLWGAVGGPSNGRHGEKEKRGNRYGAIHGPLQRNEWCAEARPLYHWAGGIARAVTRRPTR